MVSPSSSAMPVGSKEELSLPSTNEYEEEQDWDVEAILDQRGKGKNLRYLVKWAGVDKSGKPWPDDWVPKSDCSDELIAAWEGSRGRSKSTDAMSNMGTKLPTNKRRNNAHDDESWREHSKRSRIHTPSARPARLLRSSVTQSPGEESRRPVDRADGSLSDSMGLNRHSGADNLERPSGVVTPQKPGSSPLATRGAIQAIPSTVAKVVIRLSPSQTFTGLVPLTIAKSGRPKTKVPLSRDKDLSSPQASGIVTQSTTDSSQHNQTEQIDQFSSPPPVQPAGDLGIGQPPFSSGEHISTEGDSKPNNLIDETETVPPGFIKRTVDGEDVFVVIGTDDESEGGEEQDADQDQDVSTRNINGESESLSYSNEETLDPEFLREVAMEMQANDPDTVEDGLDADLDALDALDNESQLDVEAEGDERVIPETRSTSGEAVLVDGAVTGGKSLHPCIQTQANITVALPCPFPACQHASTSLSDMVAHVTDHLETEATAPKTISNAVASSTEIIETVIITSNAESVPDQSVEKPVNEELPADLAVPSVSDVADSSSLSEMPAEVREPVRASSELEGGEPDPASAEALESLSANLPKPPGASLPRPADILPVSATLSQTDEQPTIGDGGADGLRSQVSQLQDQLKKSRRKVKNLESQSDFLTMQYRQASDSAVESVRRVEELEAVITTLREQLVLGLKQRDMHFAAVKEQTLAENAKLRASNRILLDQARLTDDKVRRRAADYPRLEQELDEARERAIVAERKADRLSDRNDQLLEQISVIRAYKMGVFGPPPEGLDDETDDEDDEEGAQGSSAVFGETVPGLAGYDTYAADT